MKSIINSKKRLLILIVLLLFSSMYGINYAYAQNNDCPQSGTLGFFFGCTSSAQVLNAAEDTNYTCAASGEKCFKCVAGSVFYDNIGCLQIGRGICPSCNSGYKCFNDDFCAPNPNTGCINCQGYCINNTQKSCFTRQQLINNAGLVSIIELDYDSLQTLASYFNNSPNLLPQTFLPGSYIAYGLGVGISTQGSALSRQLNYEWDTKCSNSRGCYRRMVQRFTPDDDATGYCLYDSQCLNQSLKCVDSGHYSDDNYCEDGNWSSRTKLIALKLLNIVSSDFILFCDNKDNTLNYLKYQVGGKTASTVLDTDLLSNNFCVIKNPNLVIVATSVNKNLTKLPTNSLNVFGVVNCDNVADDGQYNPCDSTGKVWMNKNLRSFIFSSSTLNIQTGQYQKSMFQQLILDPALSIISSIKRLITQPPYDESYSNLPNRFDKLYISRQGTKEIRAHIHGKSIKNIVIEYKGFNTDICRFTDKYNQAKKDISSGILCKNEGNNYYVLAQGSQFTNINPESIWLDLTSKLRLR